VAPATSPFTQTVGTARILTWKQERYAGSVNCMTRSSLPAERSKFDQMRRKGPSISSPRRFSREQRRALKKLADNPRGLTVHFLLVHGFSAEALSSLVLTKLATIVTEPMMARPGVTHMVKLIRITDAGRMSLERRPKPHTASLGMRELLLLFRVGSGTDWQPAGVTGETISALVVRGLIMKDIKGRLALTDDGRAALRALLPELHS
jgi:hypothetical protein